MNSAFNVEKSLMQARWVMPDVALDKVERLARQHDLPEIVARLLCARGVQDDEVEGFLNPTLRNNFPDPFLLQDVQDAAEYLAKAIQDKRSIAIFGDFDVDGATSSALLYRFLKYCGIEAPIYIPGRLTEGYGPNEEAFKSLKEQGAEIVILLDCGTTAFDTIKAGKDIGLEIVVVDHHEAEEALPDAVHVINPKRQDDSSGLDMLAAVGVTFMVCVAVNKVLREAGFYAGEEAPLKEWLDLVALGTVCDMVPLAGVNRVLVRTGFERMNFTQNAGLKALTETAGINPPFTPYHAGFVLGPRINAGSRVHHSELGAKLLSTDDAEEAKNIAWTLHDCNEKRKAIQQTMEREAIEKVEAHGLDQAPVIIVDDQGWHQGLSGLVAGRLKEKYGKPACVISYSDDEGELQEGRGSGRSIPGVHIAQAFIDARNEGLLVKGGGHAMAGGFTIDPAKLEEFRAFMVNHIEAQMSSSDTQIETMIDGILTVRGVTVDLVKTLQSSIGPFGQDNPEPLFLLSNVRIQHADVVGESHIRLQVSDWEGGGRIKAMAFRAVGTPLGEALLKQTREPFHILGQLKLNEWQGRVSAEMHVKDAAFVQAGSNLAEAS